jgi:uncharacterized repeat protein (TIGR02543 family)
MKKNQWLDFAFILMVFAVIIASLFLSACKDPGYETGGGGTGTITLKVSSASRAAFGDETDVSKLKHTITLTGPGDTQTFTLNGSGTVNATVNKGKWAVNVKAELDNLPYAVGSNTVNVIAGQSNDITIKMEEILFTILFDANGGSGTVPSAQSFAPRNGTTIPSSSLTYSGYAFLGWTVNSNSSGIVYNAGNAFTPTTGTTMSTTLYAKWNLAYTVTFNLNGATGTVPPTQTVQSGDSITLPSYTGITPPASYNCKFDGWNTNAAGTGTNYNSGDIFIPTADTAIYAKWVPYETGDKGPGGGIIFYRSNTTGFPMTYNSSTCYYLEAAPVDWKSGGDSDSSIVWATTTSPAFGDVPGTDSVIGTGRKNTQLILAAVIAASGTPSSDTPAAYACDIYNGGGKNDWFLPSSNELSTLRDSYANNGLTDIGLVLINTSPYWSSTQDYVTPNPNQVLVYYNVGSGNYKKDGSNTISSSVRPIRAF